MNQMNKPTIYTLSPARGQALLNFQGRLFPSAQMEVFETDTIEEVRQKNKQNKPSETELNSDFRNLLIHGDCLSACAYLKSKDIKVDLVYIDPPFASGANYAKKIYLRNGNSEAVENDDSSIGEEIMYGDIWQKEDYLNWLYERLLAIREVMSETASIYVHLDWHIGHYVKVLMDEVFGEENFQREIIWSKGNVSGFKGHANNWIQVHDSIYYYTKNNDRYVFNKRYQNYSEEYLNNFNKVDEKGKKYWQWSPTEIRYLDDLKGLPISDVWDIKYENNMSSNRTDYSTQKPEELVKKAIINRIIESSAQEGMIIADFFVGSGTTAKCTHDLKCKFIAGDIGVNAIQTTRDRLIEVGAEFDILKVNDGVRLFRNPEQTTAKIFSLIDGYKTRKDIGLGEFWDGGIVSSTGNFVPVKFIPIHDKLTKELLDILLEEIYQLQEINEGVSTVNLIYAYSEPDIDQSYVNKTIKEAGKTSIAVNLVSIDELLGEKGDKLFMPDNAVIKLTKTKEGLQVEIVRYYSPYLKQKIDEYNNRKVKKTEQLNLKDEPTEIPASKKPVTISDNGLELIESVQFDTTLRKDGVWVSNTDLEDKAGVKDKIKAVYQLPTDKFKVKIRNIAGDELIIDSDFLQKNK